MQQLKNVLDTCWERWNDGWRKGGMYVVLTPSLLLIYGPQQQSKIVTLTNIRCDAGRVYKNDNLLFKI